MMTKKQQQQMQNKDLPEYIQKKNYQMTCFICAAIIIEGFVLSAVSLIDSNLKVVIATLTYTLLMLATLIYTRITKKLNFFYVSASLMVICLTMWFLYSGGTEGFGLIWIAVIPLFTLYLIPFKGFVFLNAAVQVLLMIGLWTPLHKTALVYDFSEVFKTRFPLLYLFQFAFSVFLKRRIHMTESELVEQKNILATEIKQAALIQKTFFQQESGIYKGWELAYSCIPMAGISGDLYDLYPEKQEDLNSNTTPAERKSGRIKIKGLGLFDTSGHGISTGLITLLAKNIIRQEFYEYMNKDIIELMNQINVRFNVEKGELENYMTGILLRIGEKEENGHTNIEFVNAGHQAPVLYKKSKGSFELLNNSTLSVGAIGLSSIEPYYDSINLSMSPGDELIFYTDGVINCCAPGGRRLGQQGFIDILAENMEKDLDVQLSDIISDIASFKDIEPSKDDMTIILLRYKG